MKDYLKFVDANKWDRELRFGIFTYGENKIIWKFFISEGPYSYYFVTNVRSAFMYNIYESQRFSTMKPEKIKKLLGEEFYNKYKSGHLTIKYMQKIEKYQSEKIRKLIEKNGLEDSIKLIN